MTVLSISAKLFVLFLARHPQAFLPPWKILVNISGSGIVPLPLGRESRNILRVRTMRCATTPIDIPTLVPARAERDILDNVYYSLRSLENSS
jgi:hypothetical protein